MTDNIVIYNTLDQSVVLDIPGSDKSPLECYNDKAEIFDPIFEAFYKVYSSILLVHHNMNATLMLLSS